MTTTPTHASQQSPWFDTAMDTGIMPDHVQPSLEQQVEQVLLGTKEQYQEAMQPSPAPADWRIDELDALSDLRQAVIDGASNDWLLTFIRQRPLSGQPSPARSDKDAEREAFEAWHRSKFETKHSTGQPTRDMHNGIYAEKYGPENQQQMWEAWQFRAAKAQESAPSSESIATWQERAAKEYPSITTGTLAPWAKLKCAADEIADLRAALARRATSERSEEKPAGTITHDFNDEGVCRRCCAYSSKAHLPCIAGTTAAPNGETSNVIAGFTEWMRDTSHYPHNDDRRKPFDAFDAGAAWARRATAGNAAPTEAQAARDRADAIRYRFLIASNAATAAPGGLPDLICKIEAIIDSCTVFRRCAEAKAIGSLLDQMREYGRACIDSNAGAVIPEGWKIPRESNDKLIAFARRWKLDGDWLTCKGCKRSLIASRDGEELNHAAGCKLAAEQHPWAQLRELVTKRAPSNPPAGAKEQAK